MEQRIEGIVARITGSYSAVETDDGRYRCDLRARISRKLGRRLAVGDRVLLSPVETSGVMTETEGDGEDEALRAGVIEEILPRKSALRRARDFKRDQVICANVDRVFIVVAVLDPPYKRAFIDRLIVGAERDDLLPFVVFNKIDIAEASYAALVREDAAVYEDVGYEALVVSAATGEGLDELRRAFEERISVIVGPSGVGKSTLLNAIAPGLRLRTGDVSEQDGRGKHTTTAAQLVPLPATPGGSGRAPGWVVDTPGLRAFGLWDVTPTEVMEGFREIAELGPGCRFRNCVHRAEPGCAVIAAVEEGQVDEERYESYLRLLEEVEAEGAQRQAARRR